MDFFGPNFFFNKTTSITTTTTAILMGFDTNEINLVFLIEANNCLSYTLGGFQFWWFVVWMVGRFKVIFM